MKVHAIQRIIGQYLAFLNSGESEKWTHLFGIIDRFHHTWDPGAEQIAGSFSQSLQNEVSRRLWRRESFDARAMMLKFMEMEPEYVRQMFRDLYDESKAIDARIDRFRFYCDELLQLARQRDQTGKILAHDQDASMISFYLAGRFPEKYAIYPGLKVFQQALMQFESPKPVEFDDLERFFKVCKALHTIGHKESRLSDALGTRFATHPGRAGYMQWTGELMLSLAQNPLF